MKPRLQVMKFGGTSVGDASCIARTAKIIARGGTGEWVRGGGFGDERGDEPADRSGEECAGAGENGQGAAVVAALRAQHEAALTSLFADEEARSVGGRWKKC